MNLINDLLKDTNINPEKIPLLDNFRHRLVVGATRAISYIVHQLKEDLFVESYIKGTGVSEDGKNVHLTIWYVAWRTDNPPPQGEKD